jgi:P-type Ca2+ transporter type 2C
MMFQLQNAYISRSATRSVFAGFLDNRWLHAAVASSLLAHVLVVHVPALQAAFRTVPLSLGDWLVAAGVSATLLLAMEIAKAVSRVDGREAGSAADVSRDRPPAPA